MNDMNMTCVWWRGDTWFICCIDESKPKMAGQKGRVTRVASGCSGEEKAELRELMDKQPERFRVHFTPDYSLDPETEKR